VRRVRFLSETLGKINRMRLVHEVILWAGPLNYAAGKGGDMLMMKSIVRKDTRKTHPNKRFTFLEEGRKAFHQGL
jgi:hypothetical protein